MTDPRKMPPSLALLQDLYQLTMAYGYWKSPERNRETAFHLFFRKNPFGGGFALACGLDDVLTFVESFRFEPSDADYLATLKGADGQPLFESKFLDFLCGLRLSVGIDAVPEGTAVFENEPLLRVTGPVLECQLLETPLLNMVNFQTLVATKAARVCLAAKGEPVMEFGLRRAQGIDGGLTASRAAYVGGCVSTSNVLAGRLFDIPIAGTHAHSWVMLFGEELESFRRYASALPNNCVFLVDTYDTLEGVRRAVEVGRELRAAGHELLGIRLDSGDLAWLSIEARRILDEGGFPKAFIVGSSDLDEHLITSLKEQGATINVWGVGTRLATAYDQPALGGVYKLSAVREPGGPWEHRIKVSENPIKTTTPGLLQVRRFLAPASGDSEAEFAGDMIYDEIEGVDDDRILIDTADPNREKRIAPDAPFEDLLVPAVRGGNVVCERPPLRSIRERAQRELSLIPAATRRFVNPHRYPVGLAPRLHALRTRLVREARGLE